MPSKSSPPPKKASPQKPAPSKAAPQKGAAKKAPAPPPAAKKPAPKKPAAPPAGRGKPADAPRRAAAARTPRAQREPRPIRTGMSLDRKLDILGIVMALVGALTLLSLLSPINSSLTGGWVKAIGQVFGLGMYLFPFALLVTGLWLVLRNFERIPQLALERLLGFGLLYTGLLAGLHLVALWDTQGDPFALAAAGQGGGYIGGALYAGLHAALGTGGAAIALLAWLVIALALSLDLTVAEMVAWMGPLVERVQDGLNEALDAARARRAPGPGAGAEFRPIPPAGAGLQPGGAAGPGGPGGQSGPAAAAGAPGSTAGQPEAGGLTFTPGVEPRPWVLPPLSEILDSGDDMVYDDELDRKRAQVIEETLASFGAPARVIEINRGPTITQFGVEPDFIDSRNGRMRVRVGKIAALADDLALALSARTIRIQAPVPGKGFIGIEVPNDQITAVALRDVLENEAFRRMKSPLRFALGHNVSGHAVAADLAGMPHLLVAGATGSGKSVCVNALICCLLMNNTPDDLRLIMVDPKRVELTGYNGIPHLLAPVVVEMERVVAALQWVTREMDMRYRKLAEVGSRNIQDFNSKMVARGQKKLPYLVVIIDELADLMMLAPDETERTITRLAQLARATGIHLVIATQRPSVDVVTGLIKANFPSRIAFAVASGVDSRVILDQPGAERLLGRGDMLFQAPDAPAPVRLQGVFVSDNEIQRLVTYWQGFSSTAPTTQVAVGGVVDGPPANIPLKQMPLWDEGAEEENADPLYKEAVDLARRQGRASISMLQRNFRIGYTRAGRLIEAMEAKGIVGPPEPSTGTRQILDYGQAAPPVDEQRD